MQKYDGEDRALIRIRQHISWYGKSMGHVKPLKEAIRLATEFAAARDALTAAREQLSTLDLPSVPFSRTLHNPHNPTVPHEIAKIVCRDRSVG
jgi:hypothetical protein